MKTLLLLLGSLFSLTGYAQSLNSARNQPRSGDRLIKRMVTAREPGESGTGQVWDFSDLELQEADYELQYTSQGADTIIGTEHRTMYYYHTSGDSLFCLGYENPTTLIAYQKPELLLAFPVFQGRVTTGYFDGKGLYGEKWEVRLRGKSIVTADASGILILPGGDTLRNVLRTYTRKFLHQKMLPEPAVADRLQRDTLVFQLDRDSIEYLLANDSIHLETESWRWYADGYRYPVFETVKSKVYRRGNIHEHFTTSFVYLPDEQYYDLPHDASNQEKRDNAMYEQWEREWHLADGNEGKRNMNGDIDYYFETGDDGDLHIGYDLKVPGNVSLMLLDMQGRQLSAIRYANQPAGQYRETVSMKSYPKGNYLLRIVANEKVYAEKIVKY